MSVKSNYWSVPTSCFSVQIYECLKFGKINYFAVGMVGGISLASNKICDGLERCSPWLKYEENQGLSRTAAQLTLKSIVYISTGALFGLVGNMAAPAMGISVAYGVALGAMAYVSPYIVFGICKTVEVALKCLFSKPVEDQVDLDWISKETFEFEDKIWDCLGFEGIKECKSVVQDRLSISNQLVGEQTISGLRQSRNIKHEPMEEYKKLSLCSRYKNIVAHDLRLGFLKQNQYGSKKQLFESINIMSLELSMKIFLAVQTIAKEASHAEKDMLTDGLLARLSWHIVDAVLKDQVLAKIDEVTEEVDDPFEQLPPGFENKIKIGSFEVQFINKVFEQVKNRLSDYSNEDMKKNESLTGMRLFVKKPH